MSAKIDKTQYMETVRRMRDNRKTCEEIANAIGVSRPVVLGWLKEDGLPTGNAMFNWGDKMEKAKQRKREHEKEPVKSSCDYVLSHEEIVERYGEVGQYKEERPFILEL